MKKLAIVLAITILASVTGIGVLISQKNQANIDIKVLETRLYEAQNALDIVSSETKAKTEELTSQIETLTTQLESAKAEALKAETEARANADKLTSQVESLTTQLESAKAEALKVETEAKANAEETAQKEAGLQQKNAELSVQLNETNAKAINLQMLLENSEKDKITAHAEAQAKADELAAQAASLIAELEAVKAQFESKLIQQEAVVAKLETKLAESETSRYELQNKVYAMTGEATYRNNTVCTFGVHLRDIMPELTDKWYTVTPIDLSRSGTQSFELVGGNMWIIGQVNVTVDGDNVLIDRDIILEGIGRTKILSEYLNIFKDLNSITREALEDDGLYGRGFSFGEPISIERDLGGDTNVLLYVRNVATFHPRVSNERFLVRMWENLPHRIDQRNVMIEMMDPLIKVEVPNGVH